MKNLAIMRCGEIFSDIIIPNVLLILMVKKVWKFPNIWWSYKAYEKCTNFFGHPVYQHITYAMVVPSIRLYTVGDRSRAFVVAASRIWNSLPLHVTTGHFMIHHNRYRLSRRGWSHFCSAHVPRRINRPNSLKAHSYLLTNILTNYITGQKSKHKIIKNYLYWTRV